LHDPELIPIGIKLKKAGKTVIFDSHEDVPQQIMSKKYIPFFIRRIIFHLYSKYEIRAIRKFDAVISVSPNIVQRLKQYNQHTIQITNYPIVKAIIPNTEISTQTVCFAGQISALWMHENILSAISNLTNVKYNLAGPVDQKYLQKLQKQDSWEQVNFVGNIDRSMVFDFIKKSAAGLALYDYSAELGYNVGSLGNTKLFEYMQVGIPVICTDFILWKQIIDEEQCGIYVNPRDIKSIANAIEQVLENPDKAKEMGKRGQKAVLEKYNWSTQEKILLKLYKSVTE
jgi:glycosyltransferase involved in cell wall biosynthesis